MSFVKFDTQVNKSRFEEAADLIKNEFSSLNLDQQYRNAFGRLLKQDPLQRVQMMGTDQRDLFTPVLKDLLNQNMSRPGHLFDMGGGDGQTFKLVEDFVPQGSQISILEPNGKYLSQYKSYIEAHPELRLGTAIESGLDDIEESSKHSPEEFSMCVSLGIHMIYFLPDIAKSLKEMYRYLRKEGVLFIVFAEESEAYTGHTGRAYYKATKRDSDLENIELKIATRREIFGSEPSAKHAESILNGAFPEFQAKVETFVQPSRLYGHSLADIIALCNIAELAGVDDLKKFETTRNLLEESPELLDLRIETREDDPRRGMLSIAQPQRVVIIRKS